MKITFELQPCLKNPSGIGIYTYQLALALQQYPDVELKGNIFNFLKRNDLSCDTMGLDFEQSICWMFPYGIYRRIWHYVPIPYSQLFSQSTELTHFFNFIVPPGVKGKVITTIHDLTYYFYPETMDKRNLKRIVKDVHYSIQRADKIVTVSESSKKDLVAIENISPEKIVVVPPGVDYDFFAQQYSQETKAQIVEKYQLPEQYLLYMGTLEPRKNIENIIRGFHLNKTQGKNGWSSLKLILAGKKGWGYQSILETVHLLGLEDEVIFTDYINEKDKPIIYQLAQGFIFPSLYEGFGMPILEAMAAGVPVITSDVSSMPEVAGDAALLVAPNDVQAIAEAMEKIFADAVLRQQCIEKGKIRAQKFTWQASAETLYQLYRQVLRG